MTLYVKEPRSSIWDAVGQDHIRGQRADDDRGWVATDDPMGMRRRRAAKLAEIQQSSDMDSDVEVPVAAPPPEVTAADISSNHSLMRVFSVIFALE